MGRILGDVLEEFAASSNKELVVVSPFIKKTALDRLLSRVGDEVSLNVVTRWWPSEVAMRVSDTEIADTLALRDGARLSLCDALHAKIYCADNDVLVGSANLTQKALGWCPSPNIEILVPSKRTDSLVADALEEIFARSYVATEEIRQEVEELAAAWKDISPAGAARNFMVEDVIWVPSCSEPAVLFETYNEEGSQLPEDLVALNVPVGLPYDRFFMALKALALETPFMRLTLEKLRLNGELTTSDVEAVVRDLGVEGHVYPQALFNAVFRWLDYLLPQSFRTQPSEVKIVLGRNL